ncbi:hypothetical protein AB1Y20_016921 [Prymnesium parvum]|uniref:Natural resistance-associated macrophage protein n=1 Tax=Prymnesium parvum TaxID=97485 RepID=A0AB34IDR7_PRYPA
MPEDSGRRINGELAAASTTRHVDLSIHREHDAEVEVESDEDDPNPSRGAPLRFRFSWRKLWRFSGPGWLMSLAYLDPGNLESDLQQGACTGLSLVWVLWWATVLGLILQEMSARLGIVTGRDLAQTIRRGYPRWLTYVIYVNMEIAVIGSDIQEVVGTGIAINLLSKQIIPVWVGCLITAVDTLSFFAIQYLGVRYLEGFICVLISTMTICFFINWSKSGGSDVVQLARGWGVPSVQPWAVTQAVATIGAVIMPHNLYLHSGLVLSRKVSRDKDQRVYDAIWYSRLESAGALLASFFINLAIVAVNAKQFYNVECAQLADGAKGCMSLEAYIRSEQNVSETVPCNHDAPTPHVCGDFGLKSEGYALQQSLGDYTLYLWALGLFAAGQAATMVCTYSGQIIMGGTLEIQLQPWMRVAITRVFALGPALAIAASTTTNQDLFNEINEYLNVLQSIQLPFAMLPVLHFTSQFEILGRFRSGIVMTAFSTLLAVLVIGVSMFLVIQFIQDFSDGAIACVAVYGVFYLAVCLRMIWSEITTLVVWGRECCSSWLPKKEQHQLLQPLHSPQTTQSGPE